MRTPEAEALAGSCRMMKLSHEPGADRRALTKLATGCEVFSPLTALEATSFPEAVLLDATGLAPLWDQVVETGENNLARAVQRWFQRQGLAPLVAIAMTPGLALAATRYGVWLGDSNNGAPFVLGEAAPQVDCLPVEALRLDPVVVETLCRLGVETVGALRSLPRASLPSRFGPQLGRRLDQLLGTAPEPLVSVRDAPPLTASWQYETPVSNAEVLSRTVAVLLEKLSAAMSDRRCGALRVLITYELDALSNANAIERVALRLFRPTASAIELHELSELYSSKLRMRAPVRAIHAVVGSTSPLDSQQRTLFEDDAREDRHETALLVNRLASRIGFDRVSRVERRKSIDPERSFSLVPATDSRPERFVQTPRQAERARRLPLAMLGADGVLTDATTHADGAPRFVRDGGEFRVLRCWGPERVETGWWRGRSVRRDAYWVELEDGRRLWLTLDLRSRRWRIAGEFC